MNIFRKVGNAFSWLGSRTLWVIRRNETVFAISLAAELLPIPALDRIFLLVKALDKKDMSGAEKMAEALVRIQLILEAYGIHIEKESELRFIIELVIKILNKQARPLN